jgi:hypothetical protein
MDHIWESNVSGTAPTYPAGLQVGYPTNTPVPTIPGAWWHHQITEEIRNVIVQASITPDATSVVQLKNAIAALIAAGTVNVANYVANDAGNMRFHWNYQGGTPSYLWGSNADAANTYLYNPANFSVNYANSAGSANSWVGSPNGGGGIGSFVNIGGQGVGGVLPAGGTWAAFVMSIVDDGNVVDARGIGGIWAGGTNLDQNGAGGGQGGHYGFAWRIA